MPTENGVMFIEAVATKIKKIQRNKSTRTNKNNYFLFFNLSAFRIFVSRQNGAGCYLPTEIAALEFLSAETYRKTLFLSSIRQTLSTLTCTCTLIIFEDLERAEKKTFFLLLLKFIQSTAYLYAAYRFV